MSADKDTLELPHEQPSEKANTTQENGTHDTHETTATTPDENNAKDGTAGPTIAGTRSTSSDPPTKKLKSIDESEAQAMVIDSLKSQILDLSTQVTQLNGKLIRSYDRISDLEDSLHSSTTRLGFTTSRVESLEQERTQHLSALNTGMLVEKSHVTAELTRLMEKASEEAVHRGEAENRRKEIEKELDDLSANLFEQANVMVRDARVQRAISERKAGEAEEALKATEEAVRAMQQSMQQLQHEKEEAEAWLRDMKGKSRLIDRPDPVASMRLFNTHPPYYEFLSLIAHLRSLHTPTSQPPSISTLLPLPFLARLLTEDSEPTVRLDLAPSLNWLSRRSVLAAIHSNQLIIEPMTLTALLSEPSVSKQITSGSPAASPHLPLVNSSSTHNIPCALCGSPIFGYTGSHHSPRPTVTNGTTSQNGSSWSTSIFKRTTNPNPGSRDPSPPPVPARARGHTSNSSNIKQVYVFRLATPTSSFQAIPLPISLPSALQSQGSTSPTTAYHPSNTPSTSKSPTPSHTPVRYNSPQANTSAIYPLCTNGWCLARLRSTCTLWAFVRTGIVEKVWEEETPAAHISAVSAASTNGDDKLAGSTTVSRKGSTEEPSLSAKPPVPPRRRGLWGMASALGERAANWTRESSRDRVQSDASSKSGDDDKRYTNPLPPPPPTHPQSAQEGPTAPPPLPKRSEGRRPVPPLPPSKEVASQSTTTPENTLHPPPHQPASTSAPPQEASESSTKPDSSENAVNFDKPPVSPRNFPLPESRPGTPTGPSLPPRVSKLNPNGSPSRSGSPAPGVGGAPPPPLPRRAAARTARPLSTIGADASNASRPATPAGGTVSDSAETKTDTETNVPADGERVSPSPKDARPPTEPKEVEESTQSLPPLSDGKVNVTEEVSKDDPAIHSKVTDDSNAKEPPADSSVETPPAYQKVNGVDGVPEKADDPSQDTDVPDPEPASGDKGPSEQTVPEEKFGKDDFVGDSTWEERAWTEIVRLREDMFWARIGASR